MATLLDLEGQGLLVGDHITLNQRGVKMLTRVSPELELHEGDTGKYGGVDQREKNIRAWSHFDRPLDRRLVLFQVGKKRRITFSIHQGVDYWKGDIKKWMI